MPQVVARVAHTYDRRRREVGERYEADPRLVHILIGTGFARVVEEGLDYQTASIATAPRKKRRG